MLYAAIYTVPCLQKLRVLYRMFHAQDSVTKIKAIFHGLSEIIEKWRSAWYDY